jgi:hypothetical protein
VFKHAGDPDPVYATYVDHLPPDPVAAMQWLRVRQPRKWGQPEPADSGLIERLNKARARLAEGWGTSPSPPPLQQADDPDSEPTTDMDPDSDDDLRPDDSPEPEPGCDKPGQPPSLACPSKTRTQNPTRTRTLIRPRH